MLLPNMDNDWYYVLKMCSLETSDTIPYKLCDWVNESHLNMDWLCSQPIGTYKIPISIVSTLFLRNPVFDEKFAEKLGTHSKAVPWMGGKNWR